MTGVACKTFNSVFHSLRVCGDGAGNGSASLDGTAAVPVLDGAGWADDSDQIPFTFGAHNGVILQVDGVSFAAGRRCEPPYMTAPAAITPAR